MIQSKEDEQEVVELSPEELKLANELLEGQIDTLEEQIGVQEGNVIALMSKVNRLEGELKQSEEAKISALSQVDRLEFDMANTIREMTFNGLELSMQKPVIWIKMGSPNMLPEKQMSLLYHNLRNRYRHLDFMFITPNNIDISELSYDELKRWGLQRTTIGKARSLWIKIKKSIAKITANISKS